MDDLVAALREGTDAQVRAHEQRLLTQLDAVRRELASRAKQQVQKHKEAREMSSGPSRQELARRAMQQRKEKKAREKAEVERLTALFEGMALSALKAYIDSLQPGHALAQKILVLKVRKVRLPARTALPKSHNASLPCDRNADADHWRNHGA